jgi:hypothetical protein
MDYLKWVLLVLTLLVLTSLLCWFAYDLLLLSPLFSVIFFLVGVLSVVMVVDAIKAFLIP